jgi:hypothetical protein
MSSVADGTLVETWLAHDALGFAERSDVRDRNENRFGRTRTRSLYGVLRTTSPQRRRYVTTGAKPGPSGQGYAPYDPLGNRKLHYGRRRPMMDAQRGKVGGWVGVRRIPKIEPAPIEPHHRGMKVRQVDGTARIYRGSKPRWSVDAVSAAVQGDTASVWTCNPPDRASGSRTVYEPGTLHAGRGSCLRGLTERPDAPRGNPRCSRRGGCQST